MNMKIIFILFLILSCVACESNKFKFQCEAILYQDGLIFKKFRTRYTKRSCNNVCWSQFNEFHISTENGKIYFSYSEENNYFSYSILCSPINNSIRYKNNEVKEEEIIIND